MAGIQDMFLKENCRILDNLKRNVVVARYFCIAVGGCTQASWRLSHLIRHQTCLCKEFGGYLTRCALPRQSLKLIIISEELLGQLKRQKARNK